MRHPLALTLVVYIAGLGAAGQFAKLAVNFLALTEVYPDQETTLGLTISVISLMGVLFGLVAGMVVNRIGPRHALIIGLFLGAATSLWQAGLPALPVMIASRVLEGASQLLIVVAAPTLIADQAGERFRPAALTLWSTFFGVAFALMALIAPSVIAFGGLSILIAGHGVWMGVAGLMCVVALPRSEPAVSESLPLKSILQRHATAYATPGIATPAFAWLCYTLTFVSILTSLPLVTNGQAPVWLAPLAPLLSIAVALTIGIALLSRLPALRVVLIGFAGCFGAAVCVAMFGFSAVTILVLFAAMALVQGSGFAIVPQLNADADSRALANGALAQMGNLGNLTGTPILIALYQGAPLWGPVLFLGAAYAAGGIVTWAIGKRAMRVA